VVDWSSVSAAAATQDGGEPRAFVFTVHELIGVNAAGVATPQYFDKCFILFFLFSGTSEYRKSLSFSSAMRPVYSF